MQLTTAETRVIEALGTYRFLTLDQMVRLNVGEHKDTPRKAALTLYTRAKPLVRCFPLGVSPKHGKLPNVYALTERGADVAAELLGVSRQEVQFIWSTNNPSLAQYHHILGLVDIHIAVRQWADANNHTIALFNNRRNYTGANRRKPGEQPLEIKTKLPITGQKSLIPDTVFVLSNSIGKDYLFCVEYQREINRAKLVNKIAAYCTAIGHLDVHKKFNFDTERDPMILIVTDSEGQYKSAIADMKRIEGFADYLPLFRFKTITDFKKNFLSDWHGADVAGLVSAYFPDATLSSPTADDLDRTHRRTFNPAKSEVREEITKLAKTL